MFEPVQAGLEGDYIARRLQTVCSSLQFHQICMLNFRDKTKLPRISSTFLNLPGVSWFVGRKFCVLRWDLEMVRVTVVWRLGRDLGWPQGAPLEPLPTGYIYKLG